MEQWYREAGAVAVCSGRRSAARWASRPTRDGGTRMGDNPETNVVDRWGFSHEVPNLGVLGASVMGTSGARNPTLTAQALAWRTVEHLTKNWKKRFRRIEAGPDATVSASACAARFQIVRAVRHPVRRRHLVRGFLLGERRLRLADGRDFGVRAVAQADPSRGT